MDIEKARDIALTLPSVTEELFAENWISFRVGGKWFLLMQLDAPEPRIAVKLPPEQAVSLREAHEGITPAYHMNKTHWSDLYLERLDDGLVRTLIEASYRLVFDKLPKKVRLEITAAR